MYRHRLTEEQRLVINSTGSIKINAIAGSGKTSTLIEYAKSRYGKPSILYLAFNKAVRQEAMSRFGNHGLDNIRIETAHSLAHKFIVKQNGYKVKASDYKAHEVVHILGLNQYTKSMFYHIVAVHVLRFMSYYCNSDKTEIRELNYVRCLSDQSAIEFAKKYYTTIENGTVMLFDLMNEGKIDITHDFYLKKFQLQKVELKFEYILFDEGQDASPAMLDTFLRQECTKVIVGDTFQQIYSWRFAINALEQIDFPVYFLNYSFRFSHEIAVAAMKILEFRCIIEEKEVPVIKGLGNHNELEIKASIGRTNAGVLRNAIEYIKASAETEKIYFEAHLRNYTYVEQGASIEDILNLYNGNLTKIKDNLLKMMGSISDLEMYVKETGDRQLGLMLEIVLEYKESLPVYLEALKQRHVSDSERKSAGMIFSTVHKAKGMEYDEVSIIDDFLKFEDYEELKTEESDSTIISDLREEINLMYVGITRTRNKLNLPMSFKKFGIIAGDKINFREA